MQDIGKLEHEKREKEKEVELIRRDMQDNYVKKDFVDELHKKIAELRSSLMTQQEETNATKKSFKFLEDKLNKVTHEKEMYLTEVLKQKEK